MKFVHVDMELAGYFFSLDPFNCLNKLVLPGCFALGAFQETERGDEPVSLIICQDIDDRLVIHWMYTLPGFRGSAIGSRLLILAFEEATARGVIDVAARISDEYDIKAFNWHSWDFFVNEVFSKVEDGEVEWVLNMGDLANLLSREEKRNESAAKKRGVVQLGSLSKKERMICINDLEKTFQRTQEGGIEAAMAVADQDMSFCRITDGRCTGMLLTRRFGGTWYPYALISDDEEDEEILVRSAMYYSEDYLQLGDRIEIDVKRIAVKKMLEELHVPGQVYDVAYLTATIKDYLKQKELPDITKEEGGN